MSTGYDMWNGKIWGLLGLLGMAGCLPPTPVLQPRTITVTVMDGTRPVVGADVVLDASDPTGVHNGATDASGVARLLLVPPRWVNAQLTVKSSGCDPYGQSVVLPFAKDAALAVTLHCPPPAPILPPPPTREEILNVRLTFQGLTVHCEPYGDLPWFEAVLPWLSPQCRQAAYAAKHASTAWPGGDTHAIVFLPSGPALYDEPGQPYSADRFGPLDWTSGNTAIDRKLADLIAEVARAGFPRQLLFLGGDDGSTCGQTPVPPTCGYEIARTQLPLVAEALQHSKYGDLRQYVVVLPGWDGVFYGYTPEQIHAWGALCRTLMPYCGIEHSTGHIPAGDGPSEWAAPDGPMRAYDLVLSEFDDARFDDSVWQIAARLIGPAYRRPADQPSGDDPLSPFYLKDATERGSIVTCAFEFYEYGWVRGGASRAAVQASRDYFTRLGYGCGG